MKHKKLFISIFSFILVILATSCQKSEEADYTYDGQIAPYFHTATFTNYKEYEADEVDDVVDSFACSEVRNGDYVGRNFDFLFNDISAFLVKVNRTDEHYASIGIARCFNIHETNVVNNDEVFKNELPYLPNLTLDGINENGVYIGDNVVRVEHGQSVTGTNPSAERKINIFMVPRYILDHAKSASHAIELLEDCNIYGAFGPSETQETLHYLICDLEKTYIVEFWDNQMLVEEKTGDNQIMTNFYVNTKDSDGNYVMNEHPNGVERYEILKENYALGSTMEGMFNLMKMVKFSDLYYDLTDHPRFSDTAFFTKTELENLTSDQKNECIQFLLDDMPRFDHVIATNDRFGETNGGVVVDWITIYNTTYDIRNKKVILSVCEDYLHTYSFSL